MKEVIRKMNLSIITCMLVLVLNVTTTFAWAGLQNYSNVENFDVSLESSENYAIQVSLDGKNFSKTIDEYEYKKAILRNMGCSEEELEDEADIDKFISNIELEPLTTKRVGNELGPFASIDDIRETNFNYDEFNGKKNKKSYFNFDVYVSVEYKGSDANENFYSDYQDIYVMYLDNLLVGDNKTYSLKSKHSLKNYLLNHEFSAVRVNSSSAARISFTKYEVMTKGNPIDNQASETVIYQGGSAEPSYKNDVYSFGGFLNKEDNLAYMDFNDVHSHKPINDEVFDDFYNNRKNDKGLEEALSFEQTDGLKFKLIDENDKLNTKTMIKINVKMWIEGFDSDCFEVISAMPVGFNLVFSHFNLH